MSIYGRKYHATRWLTNDIYARPRPTELENQLAPLPNPTGSQPHKRSKAEPANVPLRTTLNWVSGLPSEVRPAVLVRQFARIANLIAATWEDPPAFDLYVDGLLTDQRGGRKGFPPVVQGELLALKLHHGSQQPQSVLDRHVSRKRG